MQDVREQSSACVWPDRRWLLYGGPRTTSDDRRDPKTTEGGYRVTMATHKQRLVVEGFPAIVVFLLVPSFLLSPTFS